MLESDGEERPKGWKPSGVGVALLIVAALALAGLTCWVFKINPLPSHNVTDPGMFLTFALVYFFVLYLTVERLKRRG